MASDLDLVTRIKLRDADALAELYDRYSTRVYSLAVMILGEGMAAQEVTQDTFMKVWSQPDHYRYENGRFLGWLLTITRHIAIDRLRRERRQGANVDSIDDDSFPELRDRAQDDEARWRDLKLALDQLPAEQRDVMMLAYYRGMSQSEIAAHLGLALGTVKTRLRLGMDKLRSAWIRFQ